MDDLSKHLLKKALAERFSLRTANDYDAIAVGGWPEGEPTRWAWGLVLGVLFAGAAAGVCDSACREWVGKHEAHDFAAMGMDVHAEARSGQWPAVQREHLRREPACVVCGHTGEGLIVHHRIPFHDAPERELDDGKDGTGTDGNLVTGCGPQGRCDAHYWCFHAGNWRGHNPHCREDAALMRHRWKESARLAKQQ